MKIRICTSLPTLGFDLAADLEAKGFGPVAVQVGETGSYQLRHRAGMPATELKTLLDSVAPFQPEEIHEDDLDKVDVEIGLFDEGWLNGHAVILFCDSDDIARKIRDTLARFGMTVQEDNRWVLDEDVLFTNDAPALARHLVRWVVKRQGVDLGERPKPPGDETITLVVRDPAQKGRPWNERAQVRVRSDDPEAGTRLIKRLSGEGFRCHPLLQLSSDEASEVPVRLAGGAFSPERTPAEFARLRLALEELIADLKVDQERYPLVIDGSSRELDAVVDLPLRACRGKDKRPYGGSFPQRFRITVFTDDPERSNGLVQRLRKAGFDQISVQQQANILEEDPESADSNEMEQMLRTRKLDGFSIVWGAAGKYAAITHALRQTVAEEMRERHVTDGFEVSETNSFAEDDPDIWIEFPIEGADDGRLLQAYLDPHRFTVKLHTPRPDDWQDVAAELAAWGFGKFEVVELDSAPKSIHYGGAPRSLINRLGTFLRERTGFALESVKAWGREDLDIFFFLPRRKRPPKTITGAAATGLAAGWRGSPQRQQAVQALDSFGRMLTDVDLAGRGKTAREGAFRKLVTTLSKMKRRNVIIVGNPGTGKTALVYDLARRMQTQDVSLPERLRDLDIFEMSPTFLRSGTMYVGDYEKRITNLLRVLQANPKIILFIDEVHSMFQSGRHERGPFTDANESFKGALARGDLTLIGCTTMDEYRHAIEPDTALARRFEIIVLEPPTALETLEILQSRLERLRAHYAPLAISETILPRVVELTEEYLPSRHQPDKSIQLLDQACALATTITPPLPALTEETLYEALESATGHKLVRQQVLTQDEVYRYLSAKIIGQDAVLRSLGQAVVAGMGGWQDRRGPRGVFLFAGPTGVGKTETALALAEVLGGGRDALIRIDCNTLQSGQGAEHVARSQLLGIPPGYVGYVRGQGGLLSRIRNRPECVVLFDEFEKAGHEVGELILQVIDNGHVEDADGSLLDFRRSFLVFTTNAGVTYEEPAPFGFHAGSGDGTVAKPQVDPEAVRQELRSRVGLGEEFLGRITHVFAFQGLTPDVIRRVLQVQLDQLKALAARRGFHLEWAPAVEDHLAAQWQPRFGVRHLTTILRNRIVEQLSVAEAQGELKGVIRIRLELLAPGNGLPCAGTAGRCRQGDALVIQLA